MQRNHIILYPISFVCVGDFLTRVSAAW